MPAYRFYVKELPEKGENVTLGKEEAKHATLVMRKQVGDALELVDGKGGLATGMIEVAGKKEVVCKITDIKRVDKPPFFSILYQALPRMNRLSTLVEKATELGVGEIRLFPGERSEKKELSDHQIERLEGIIVSASKQSGRLFFPKVTLLEKISKWKPFESPVFYGSLNQEAPKLKDRLNEKVQEAGFIIGPEAGLSEKEEGVLESLGAQGTALHRNILRTDTAPIAALAILHHICEE